MNSTSFGYLTKEGFRNLRVNHLMSLASICVLFSCLVITGLSFMLLVNINSFLGKMEAQNVVVVFVEDNATDMQIAQLGERIDSLATVGSTEFVAKEDAFRDQLSSFGDFSELFNDVTANPLPDMFRVTVNDMSKFGTTVEKLSNMDNVLRIRENSELASTFSSLRNTVTYLSVAVIILLFAVSLFIISNTIRITMHGRKLEISIMKSVGATNSFIRWPFMIEGVLLGIISGVAALFAVWGSYDVIVRALSSLSGVFSSLGNAVSFQDYILPLLGIFVLFGVFAGTFGSFSSIRKYLKEKEFVKLDEEIL